MATLYCLIVILARLLHTLLENITMYGRHGRSLRHWVGEIHRLASIECGWLLEEESSLRMRHMISMAMALRSKTLDTLRGVVIAWKAVAVVGK
jgi:hypothetical protein